MRCDRARLRHRRHPMAGAACPFAMLKHTRARAPIPLLPPNEGRGPARHGRSLEKGDRVSESALGRNRSARGGHRSRAGSGCRGEGRQRPPRHRDEPGARRLPAVPAGDAPRPGRHALARPRPVHPVGGALVAHAVRAALPRRVRPRARRPQGAAHVGIADTRPPRVRPHEGRRDHDRSAGPGSVLGGRLRLRRALRARPVRPGCRAPANRPSTTSST